MIWMYDVQEVNGSYVCTGQRPVASNTPTAESLVTYTRNCLDALGIRNGASHSEVILTADGPCLVEVRCVKEPWESWESQTWIRPLPFRLSRTNPRQKQRTWSGAVCFDALKKQFMLVPDRFTEEGNHHHDPRTTRKRTQVNCRCQGGDGFWMPLTQRMAGYSQVGLQPSPSPCSCE